MARRRARRAVRSGTRAGRSTGRGGGAVASAGLPVLRIGCGADAHPLRPGRRLVLGGTEIPHPRGLMGHSDADVLAHALCDAILGALALPDMGLRFPETDEAFRGRSSLWFLREVAGAARARGFEIMNVDAVILAEAPRLQPHLEAMRTALAGALDVPVESVGLKAKRLEGLGAVGRREGIMAQAVALLGARAT